MSTRTSVALSLAILLTVAFAIAPLLVGAAVPHWDANDYFAPYQALISDFARHGQVLLWNPWSMGGSPDFAEPQIGALSPLSVLAGFLAGGGLTGFAVYWMLLWFLGAVGVQLLSHSWGVPPVGGAIAGLAYVFSGVFTGHAEHVSVIVSAAALPFVVWRLDAALLRPSSTSLSGSVLSAFEAGGLLGLGALSGYPGLTFLTACFVSLWAFARALAPPPKSALVELPRARRLVIATRTVVIVGVTAAIVLAPTYAGFFWEAGAQTSRASGLSLSSALTNSLAPGALATLASPYLARLPLYNPGLWGDNDVSSASIYVGPLVTVLAVSALFEERRPSRWRLFLGGAAALSLVLSLGHALPVRGWVNQFVPGFHFFRHPSMTRLYFVFCLVALSLEALRSEPSEPLAAAAPHEHRRLMVRFAVAVVACGVAILAFRHAILSAPGGAGGTEEREIGLRLGEAHYLSVWIATAVIMGVALRGGFRRRPALALLLFGFVAFADAALNGYLSRPITLDADPGQLSIWKKLEAERETALTLDSPARSFEPLLGQGNHNLILKVPVLKSYSPLLTDRWFRAWLEHPALRAAAVGRGRVRFSSEAVLLPVDDPAFESFVTRADELGALPLVVESPRATPGLTAAPASAGVPLALAPAAETLPIDALETYTPRRLTFTVTVPGPGWLLVTDRWAPGWTARVEGMDTEIRRGAFLFRAVRVPAGHVRVDFSYRPFGYPGLLIASWLALCAAALARLSGKLATRRSRA